MEIEGKVHLLFEQSGIFKAEFTKLGFEAFDYDIENEFGCTDFVMDIFSEIESAYAGFRSIFDSFGSCDLVMAFFPCIYFCEGSQILNTYFSYGYRSMTVREKTKHILKRQAARSYYLGLLTKLFCVVIEKKIRFILENPATNSYLVIGQNFVMKPTLIDWDRTIRGDYYAKPTAYWFVNCQPSRRLSVQQTPASAMKYVCNEARSKVAGQCSIKRSLISSDYARNFICDFILDKPQAFISNTLFD